MRNPFARSIGVCPSCGKKRFRTKADAKAAARVITDNERGAVAEYPCGDWYHVGHLPAAVKNGTISRSQLNGGPGMASTATVRRATPKDVPQQRVGVRKALKAVSVDEPGPLPDETTIMDVSPELAASWLLRNERNRPVKEGVVNALSRDMTAGKWRFTGAAIQFDQQGVLADGQHRLLALVKSHTTQRFVVVVGLEEEAMEVIDTGSKRTVADALSIRGDAVVDVSAGQMTLIAAAAKIGVKMQQGTILSGAVQLTTTESMDWIREHPEIAESVRRAAQARKHVDVPPAVLAYCMWRLGRVDAVEAEGFFLDWRDMRTDGVGDPLQALMARLRSAKESRERLSQAALISMVFRAWNARRQGVQLRRMQATSDGGSITIPEPK